MTIGLACKHTEGDDKRDGRLSSTVAQLKMFTNFTSLAESTSKLIERRMSSP